MAELGLAISLSVIYSTLSQERGLIWSTDHRTYRSCGDDGSMAGMLLGPLLAATMLLASLQEPISPQRSPNQEALKSPLWKVESPIAVLGTQNQRAFQQSTSLPALSLSRCTLLSLQTVISLIFLIHLEASKTAQGLQSSAAKSKKGRFVSYVAFACAVTCLLFAMRETFDWLGLPIWTGESVSTIVRS